MIGKPLLLSLLLLICLPACAPASQPGAAAPTVTAVYTPADQSLATPMVGAATVLGPQGGPPVFMHSLPAAVSAIAAEVKPGDSGRVLGVDSSGTWVLIQIKDQTGWLPIQVLNYTIAQ